jgi:hypothetical protein
MPTRSLMRSPNAIGDASNESAPIYVDSDDNRIKVVPGGAGTTAEVVLQETSGVGAAEVVTATNVILAAESGRTFFLNSATEFVSTLPAPALGLNFTFIVAAAPSGASYTIVPATGTIIHGVVVSKDLNGATDSGATAGTPVGTITLVDSKSQIGDRVDIVSDGTNWYAVCVTGGNFDAITLS